MIVCSVDGGASVSRGAVAEVSGGGVRLLAVGRGGSANANVVGRPAAEANVTSLVVALLARAGVSGSDVDGACVGCSLRETADAALAVLPNAVAVAGHDTWLAFRSGVDAGTGVVATAGTGSMVVRYADGRMTASRGGWGWAVGDSGSAVDIGRQAARLVLAANEEGRRTPLMKAVLAHVGGRDSEFDDAVYNYLYRSDSRTSVALGALAPVVSALAAEGDSEAAAIMATAARSLADQVRGVAVENDPVVLSGSVAKVLSPAVEELLQRDVVCVADGLSGALVLAAEATGIDVLVGDVRVARGEVTGGG